MKTSIFAISFVLLVLSVIHADSTSTRINEEEMGETVYQTLIAHVDVEYLGAFGLLGFRLHMLADSMSSDTLFALRLFGQNAKKWQIELGDTLRIRADSTEIVTTCLDTAPKGEKKTTEVKVMGATHKFFGGWYQISQDNLHAMALAKLLTFEIQTTKKPVSGELEKKEIALIRDFELKCVKHE